LAGIPARLCAEFGFALDEDNRPAAPSRPPPRFLSNLLSPEDEQLIASVRRSLVEIAAALGAGQPADSPETKTVQTLIDGAELVMRRELAAGKRLAGAMPSFVYLIAMPLVDQEEALEFSKRTAALVEEALR
jgi:hypothetical protein